MHVRSTLILYIILQCGLRSVYNTVACSIITYATLIQVISKVRGVQWVIFPPHVHVVHIMKQTHIFSIKISLIIYHTGILAQTKQLESLRMHIVPPSQSSAVCSCCIRTQEGDMRCSSTLCADTSRCPSGGWFWEQRPSMGHGCL